MIQDHTLVRTALGSYALVLHSRIPIVHVFDDKGEWVYDDNGDPEVVEKEREYTILFPNGAQIAYPEKELFEDDMPDIEGVLRLFLVQMFHKAKKDEIGGEFCVHVRASAAVNGGDLKIESTVELGNWDGRAEVKAGRLSDAYAVAMKRWHENKALKPLAITAR